MDLNTLSPAPGSKKKRKRVGRGPSSGTGKTSGRGHKGQKSRSGYSRRPEFEGGQMPLSRRLPKRGFKHSDRHAQAKVNVDILDQAFEDGAEVTQEALTERGLVKELRGGIKILGRGDLSKKLILKINSISAGARAKVEAAGGTVELIKNPVARAAKRRGQAKAKEE